MPANGPDKQRGFTLGETLAALAVAGIGLSLAVPGLQALSRGNAQATAVNQLVTTLHLARSEAVMRNGRVAVCASASGNGCDGRGWSDGWIAFLDGDGDLQRGPAEDLLDHVPAIGLALNSAGFGAALSFGADGRASDAARQPASGEFAFCDTGAATAARVVILRTNGLPTLAQRGRDGAPVACPAQPET